MKPYLHAISLALLCCSSACLGSPPDGEPASNNGSDTADASAPGDDGTRESDADRDRVEGGEDAGTEVRVELPRDYVRAAPFAQLDLVVDYADGVTPRRAASDHVISELSAVVNKPDGVHFVTRDQIETPGSSHVWTFEELDALAKARFGRGHTRDAIEIGVLYLDGSYEGDTDEGRVLGVAWANRYLVMFADSVEASCDEVPLVTDALCDAAEATVLLHEVGHVIGLVDNGAPMVANHKDPEHGAHDSSDECVMYWAYTGSNVLEVLLTRVGMANPALTFDDACRADLEALQ